MKSTTSEIAATAQLDYLLRIADSALILGQRLSEWCGHGPIVEEDIALANTALDLIGQARLVLGHAGKLDGHGRDEDEFAFLRAEGEFRNVALVELPNHDFARTVLRNFLFCSFLLELWRGLARSRDAELAAIAAKSVKETRYHVRHAADWTLRLGDGTAESREKMQTALDDLWPYTAEFFAPSAEDHAAVASGFGVAWSSLQAGWEAGVLPVLADATLQIPVRGAFLSRGKHGIHSEHLGRLLAEMQSLQHAYPGNVW